VSRITITLPQHLLSRVDAAVHESGLSRSAFVQRALDDYLFFSRFPEIRRIATDHARAQGLAGDEVYDLTEEETIALRDRLIRGIDAMYGAGIINIFDDPLPDLPAVRPRRRRRRRG
jgi:Arc/MetJ-type ribon-helix-helix transcriptional regulator